MRPGFRMVRSLYFTLHWKLKQQKAKFSIGFLRLSADQFGDEQCIIRVSHAISMGP